MKRPSLTGTAPLLRSTFVMSPMENGDLLLENFRELDSSKVEFENDEELLQFEAALVGAEHGDGHVGRGKIDDGGLFLAHAGTAGRDDVQRVGTSSRMNSGEEGTIGLSK